MKNKIIEILLGNSTSYDISGSIIKGVETEDMLWSGDFKKTAEEIEKLFSLASIKSSAFDWWNKMYLSEKVETIKVIGKYIGGFKHPNRVTDEECISLYLCRHYY